MEDQRVKLLMDFGLSEENARKLVAEMDRLKASTKGVADTYEVLDRVTGTYAVATSKVQQASDRAAAAAVEQTRAQKLMAQMLDEVAVKTTVVTTETTKLMGSSGMRGQGILGVSYAMQDFVAVYSGGGGFGRALGSMANNVTMVAMGLGAGVGLAGALTVVTQLVAAGIPLVGSFFGEFGKSKEATDHLKEVREEIKKVHEEFLKLKGMPTEAETERAKRVREYLGTRPHAEQARRGIEAATTEMEAETAMTEEERKQFRAAAPMAGMTDEEIEARLARGAAEGETADIRQINREALQQRRREAAAQRRTLLEQARRQRAERIVVGLPQAGPAGEEARRQLAEMTQRQPGAFPPGFAADVAQPPMTAAERQRQFEQQAQARKEVQDRIRRDVEVKNRDLEGQAKDEARGEQEQRKQDREWLAKDKQRIQAEERRIQEGAARNRREFAIGGRDVQLGRRTQLGRMATQVSIEAGKGVPTPEQANEMADNALRNMQHGMTAQRAVWAAVAAKVRAIEAAERQNAEFWGRVQMGPGMGFGGR